MRAAEGWTIARTAREFLVDEDTVRDWMRTLTDEVKPRPERVVTSKRPNHVHHVDMTVVPTVLGGFWSAVTGTLPTIFPFCWWLVVLQDHFSRRIQGFEFFKREPASAMIRAFLDRALDAVGAVPKYMVMDRGRQFDCEPFRAWCRGHLPLPKIGCASEDSTSSSRQLYCTGMLGTANHVILTTGSRWPTTGKTSRFSPPGAGRLRAGFSRNRRLSAAGQAACFQ